MSIQPSTNVIIISHHEYSDYDPKPYFNQSIVTHAELNAETVVHVNVVSSAPHPHRCYNAKKMAVISLFQTHSTIVCTKKSLEEALLILLVQCVLTNSLCRISRPARGREASPPVITQTHRPVLPRGNALPAQLRYC